MLVGSPKIGLNANAFPRFQGKLSGSPLESSGMGEANSQVSIKEDVNDVGERLSPDVLAPDLKKRWRAASAEDRKITSFILNDIHAYTAYQNQSRLGQLFQRWQKAPALVAFQNQLACNLPMEGPKTTLEHNLHNLFNQSFANMLAQFKSDLIKLKRSTFAKNEEKILVNLLRTASRANKGPLSSENLYQSLFRVLRKSEESENILKQTLKSFAEGFSDLPTYVQNFAETGTSKGTGEPLPEEDVALNSEQPYEQQEEAEFRSYTSRPLRVAIAPEHVHINEVETLVEKVIKGFNFLPKVGIILGDAADQKDALIQLALDPRIKENIYSHVLVNEPFSPFPKGKPQENVNEQFHSQWLDLPVTENALHETDRSYILEGVRYTMAEIERKTPNGENAVMFLIGDKLLLPVVDKLPELARAYPRVKLVVAGLNQLSANVNPKLYDHAAIVKVSPPSLSQVSAEFQLTQKGPLQAIEDTYHVKFPPKVIEYTAKSLMDKTGRPPNRADIMHVLENVAYQVGEKIEPTAEKRIRGGSLITTDDIDHYQTAREQFLESVGSEPESSEEGSFGFAPKSDVMLGDVIGQKEAVEEAQRLVALLKNYKLLATLKQQKNIDIKVPPLISFIGKPGTGKTMLAKALANESGFKLISLSASELRKMYLGQGAASVREIYRKANDHKPCIVFLDEIDAIARTRKGEVSSGAQEVESTLNQILVELDGFVGREGVTTIVATNRPEVLDEAFQSRQYKQIHFKMPKQADREAILKLHAQRSGFPFDGNIDFDKLAGLTKGFSGRKLEMLIRRATNHGLASLGSILDHYGQQDSPDMEALAKEVPTVTQADLMRELLAVRKRKTDKPRSNMGFHTLHRSPKAE